MPPPADLDVLLLQRSFPGMSEPESRIFRAWLAQHGADYDRFEFNVRVGAGVDVPPDTPEFVQELARSVSRPRIDVVAFGDGVVRLIEVKVRAGLSSIGQLVGYRTLYFADHPGTRRIELQVVAARTSPDVVRVLSENGIGLELLNA